MKTLPKPATLAVGFGFTKAFNPPRLKAFASSAQTRMGYPIPAKVRKEPDI